MKEEFGHELNLLLDVRTRWNSMMQMVERFLKLKNAIKKSLIDLNMSAMWNDDNIPILQSIMDILQPVKLSVEALSRKDATLLTSEAIIEVLFDKLESMDNDLAKKFLENLANEIGKRERRNINLITLIKYLHNPASIQNENERLPSNCTKNALIKFTEELYTRLYPSTSTSNETDDVQLQATPDDEQETNFELLLQRAIETAGTSKNTEAQITRTLIRKEFTHFESTGKRSANLENLYKALLTVKPTSTESERVFSLSSNFVTKIRNRLSDKSLNALVFLKAYFIQNTS